ncbi:PAS-domain containing protein [Roseobacteraceae bacterium S113]
MLGTALVLVSQTIRPRQSAPVIQDTPPTKQVAFLFKDGQLVHSSDPAQPLAEDADTLDDILSQFADRFPGLKAEPPTRTGTFHFPAANPTDPGSIEIENTGSSTSLVLNDPGASASDRHQWMDAHEQLSNLQAVIDKAPVAIWTSHADGHMLTSNSEFAHLAAEAESQSPFPLVTDDLTRPNETRRIAIENQRSGTPQWFDVVSRNLGNGRFGHYAVNADAIVTAEAAQRNFVQTLTKTFAQLSIGLAIFDRKRQLALFNPALIDLTLLPADFLSGRPSLNAFFDQLRDRQIMPEPRNYKTWRDQLSDMLTAAQDGQYCETWTLPSGLTYRISGKPHPDGAVAFLFEDISAEISLTRRFRAELELSQSVLDSLDDAIAVFSRSGTLTFSNTCFRNVWKCSPDESFIEMSIIDVTRLWQEACAPSPVWGDLRDFITRIEERADWEDTIKHKDLGALRIAAAPLSGGSTLVRFQRAGDGPMALIPRAVEETPS